MAAPLGIDPTDHRLGWTVTHLPARSARDRAPEPEGDDRCRREKRFRADGL
ncbi:hypothetical protein RB614_21500 [Phytohabitans sp. ZYX-F-186]|uniref:Uncharacterized protein n=1 Tax=Phytohabitans maris TaxID=3071409 RepID=A0ABU0ZJ68_9ACTN|nr:hypothetical protein [Phytohabitans sp. ZYX-F-186]MDQ7907092.1 hypothetical protein [Phytohabitans sp. ZYX-F-186]